MTVRPSRRTGHVPGDHQGRGARVSAASIDFSSLSERAGEPATRGQIADMCHRYRWAAECCRGRRVRDVACGSGQGLGILRSLAGSAEGCDIDANAVRAARRAHGDSSVQLASAQRLPWSDGSADAVLLFEALYYLPDVNAFLRECRRVLAPGGLLLISTTNKHLFDFVPSPRSCAYFGADTMPALLEREGFRGDLFGYSPVEGLPLLHRLLRPAKVLGRGLHALPTTMRGKARVRRLLFGRLPAMPSDLSTWPFRYQAPEPIRPGVANHTHRFIYALARLVG